MGRSALALVVLFAAVACGDLLSSADDGPQLPIRDGGADDVAIVPQDAVADDVSQPACSDTCPAERLANGLGDIVAMSVDASGIYVAQFTAAGFFRIDRAGGTPVAVKTTVAPFQANDIRVTPGRVFLSRFASPGIERTSTDNTSSEVVSGCANVFSLSATTTALFAAVQCDGSGPIEVHRFAIDGAGGAVKSAGDPLSVDGGEPLYETSKYGYLATDQQFVYLTNLHAIMKLPLAFTDGAAYERMHDVSDAPIQGLAVDDRIYVRTTNDVRSYDKNVKNAGREIIVGTEFQGSSSRLALAVDDAAIYYANIHPSDGTRGIIRRPKGTASQPVVVAKTASEASVIVLDGPLVYWATKGGEVWRVGKKTVAP